MDDSFSSPFRIHEPLASLAAQTTSVTTSSPSADDLSQQLEQQKYVRELYAREALNLRLLKRWKDSSEPFSLQWFLNIEHHRYCRYGRWIPRLLEFAKHPGERLLAFGPGLGTDWLQYAKSGADVIVCSPSATQLGLVRTNFELRGLKARLVHAQPSSLPLQSATIDVVCISNLAAATDSTSSALVEEIHRILKPGGKVIAVAPAQFDVDFWFDTVFFWYKWLGLRKTKPAEDRSLLYSGRDLRRMFCDFVEMRTYKRHLRRSEVPHVWRPFPLPILSRLMGRLLVVKAFKPLSIVLPQPAAA